MPTPHIPNARTRAPGAVSLLRSCVELAAQDLAAARRLVRRSPGAGAGAASAPVPTCAPVPASVDRAEESLLSELSRDYPELSGGAVAEILDQAWAAVCSSWFAPEDVEVLVTTVARDQLGLARARLLAAISRVGIPNQRRASGG